MSLEVTKADIFNFCLCFLSSLGSKSFQTDENAEQDRYNSTKFENYLYPVHSAYLSKPHLAEQFLSSLPNLPFNFARENVSFRI